MSTIPILRRAWQQSDYAEAIGCHKPAAVRELLGLKKGSTVYDIGCGDGHMVDYLLSFGIHAVGLDMVKAYSDTSLCNITQMADMFDYEPADYGLCLGVMDHIPEDQVPATILHIHHVARREVYFTIPIRDLGYNDLIGKKIQQTIKPIGWWRNRLTEIGSVKIEQPGDWMTAHVKCH